MARRKSKRGRSKKSKSLPILATAGTVASLGSMYTHMQTFHSDKTFTQKLMVLPYYIGWNTRDNKFDLDGLKVGTGMMWVGILGSAIAQKVPIIKTLPRKVPIVGKYLRW